MAPFSISLLLILVFIFSIFGTAEPTYATDPGSTTFIQSSCLRTQYPDQCIRWLSPYVDATLQDPKQLAHVALMVSLYRTVQAKAYITRVAKELQSRKGKYQYQAVKDCLEQLNDGVEQLSQSIKELHGFGKRPGLGDSDSVLWHISNIETWVGSALTDASTCINEFPGRGRATGKLKAAIKAKVVNVAQCTSIALALFHRFAVRFLAAAATATSKKP